MHRETTRARCNRAVTRWLVALTESLIYAIAARDEKAIWEIQETCRLALGELLD